MREQCEQETRGVVRQSWQSLWALLVVCSCALTFQPRAEAVPIRVTYTDGAGEGFNDAQLGAARRRAFEAASSVWSQRLAGTVPVRIKANFNPLGGSPTSATLGQAGPGGYFTGNGDFTTPLSDTFYVKGLANQFAGGDLDPTEYDIEAEFNSDVDGAVVLGDSSFYYGLDGRPPVDANGIAKDTDFFSTVLHELGHGLGFTGLYNGSTNTFSSGAFSSFDRYIASGANGTPLTNLAAAQRSAAVRSNNLFFIGPRTRAASSGGARLYAPASYSSGSSVYHLDEDTYSGAEELMTPISSGNPHIVGPLNLAVFLDVGWGQVGAPPAPTQTATPIPSQTPPPGPPNDDFVNAQPIAGTMGSVSGTSVRATRESGEPSHAGATGGASIWYRWTAPANGKVTFSTQGSGYDTVLAFYTGSQLTRLTPVVDGANDDEDDNIRTSRVQFAAVSGQTYGIAIDGYSNATTPVETGNVLLRWQQQAAPTTPPAAPKPMNDDFANAQLLTGPTGSFYGTNVGATLQPNEPPHGSDAGGHSIWYQWTAPVSGEVTFEINGDTFAPQLAIYTGNGLNALSRVATASDGGRVNRVTFRITQNTLYRLAVDGRNGGTGRTLLRWRVKAGPTNDDFVNAKVFATNSGALPGDNTLATKQVGEPQHTPDFADNSIWYRWTAPGDGVFAVLAQGRFNVAVVPYTGSSVTALAPVTPVLSSDTPGASRRDWQVRSGVTYNIAIIGRTTAGVPAGGQVLVRWRFTPGLTTNGPTPPPPNNTDFVTPSTASATAPSVNVSVSFGTTTEASRFSASLSDTGGGVLLNGVGFPVQNILLKGTIVTIQLLTDELRTGDQVQLNSKLLKQPLIITVY